MSSNNRQHENSDFGRSPRSFWEMDFREFSNRFFTRRNLPKVAFGLFLITGLVMSILLLAGLAVLSGPIGWLVLTAVLGVALLFTAGFSYFGGPSPIRTRLIKSLAVSLGVAALVSMAAGVLLFLGVISGPIGWAVLGGIAGLSFLFIAANAHFGTS